MLRRMWWPDIGRIERLVSFLLGVLMKEVISGTLQYFNQRPRWRPSWIFPLLLWITWPWAAMKTSVNSYPWWILRLKTNRANSRPSRRFKDAKKNESKSSLQSLMISTFSNFGGHHEIYKSESLNLFLTTAFGGLKKEHSFILHILYLIIPRISKQSQW